LTLLERNLSLLARKQPELAGILSSVQLSQARLDRSRNGLPIVYCARPSTDSIALHSRYDPLREARQALKEYDLSASNYFTFLGFGLGYLADALLEQVPPEEARVFIVESNLEILRAAMEARDLSRLLSLPHIHFAWPISSRSLADQWRSFFDPVAARQSLNIPHAPSLILAPDLFKSAAETLRSVTLQVFTDINTLVGKAPVFLENFVANFALARKSPGITDCAGRFRKTPAVLVSAGPSLDRNISHLKNYADRVLVISADTALKPLLAAGIEPHFVLSADPAYVNYLHLKDAPVDRCLLVAESTAYPDTLKMFDRRTFICQFKNSSLQELSEVLGPKGTLRAWGSVATMCLDFAMHLQCNPIIFIGQDLAFSEGRTYCTGLHWEREWFQGISNPDGWKKRWAEICERNLCVPATDIFGQPVNSTEKLVSYWNWIQAEILNHPSTQFINATEGGILNAPAEIMSLREALCRFHDSGRDLHREASEALRAAAQQPQPANERLLMKLLAESKQVSEILASVPSPALDPETNPVLLTAAMGKIKGSLFALKTLAPLLQRFNQMGTFHFLRDATSLAGKNAEEIGAVYRRYFESIVQANALLAGALNQLATEIRQ
jgi:hypothetical protein